jgi:hypothetical protein
MSQAQTVSPLVLTLVAGGWYDPPHRRGGSTGIALLQGREGQWPLDTE